MALQRVENCILPPTLTMDDNVDVYTAVMSRKRQLVNCGDFIKFIDGVRVCQHATDICRVCVMLHCSVILHVYVCQI